MLFFVTFHAIIFFEPLVSPRDFFAASISGLLFYHCYFFPIPFYQDTRYLKPVIFRRIDTHFAAKYARAELCCVMTRPSTCLARVANDSPQCAKVKCAVCGQLAGKDYRMIACVIWQIIISKLDQEKRYII